MAMARSANTANPAPVNRRVARASLPGRREAAPAQAAEVLGDRFFRHLVLNLRTGVLAITRQGRLAAMNDLAYRVLGLTARATDIGRPFTEVLQDCLLYTSDAADD